MTLTVCSEPGCPELTTASRCDEHKLPARSGRPMPKGWKKTVARIVARDRHVCAYCGGHATSADHVAASRGGSDDDSNLTACCLPCQQSKGNRPAPTRGHPATPSGLASAWGASRGPRIAPRSVSGGGRHG